MRNKYHSNNGYTHCFKTNYTTGWMIIHVCIYSSSTASLHTLDTLYFSESNQINNVGPGSGLMNQYPTLGQVSHVYEQPQPVKELNKYASLKAVGKCAWMFMLRNQQKHKPSVYCSWEAGYNPMDKSLHLTLMETWTFMRSSKTLSLNYCMIVL